MPEINDTAPDFTLPRDGGDDVTLSAMRPGKVVLFFYPRDDTSGCTAEALDFTAAASEYAAAKTHVIGVSKDTVAAHSKFIAKYGLGVTLASDTDGSVCEAYGVWVEKNMYGKKSMGIERATYLIASDGKIARVWRKVKVPGHVDEVLEAVRAL